MTNMQIAWQMLATVGGLGALLVLISVIVTAVRKSKYSKCTEKTTGVYTEHKYSGSGLLWPIVEYTVGGNTYKVKKQFRSTLTRRSSLPVEEEAWEDEKGRLHLKYGPIAYLSTFAEKLWPIGSEATVYYNPDEPKKSYVERPLVKDGLTTAYLWGGLGFIVLAMVLAYFIGFHN